MIRLSFVGLLGLSISLAACAGPIGVSTPDLLAQNAHLNGTADAMSTQFAWVNAQGTQVAAQLTATPAALTQAWQATKSALALQETQEAWQRLNAEATATAARAQTQDALAMQATQQMLAAQNGQMTATAARQQTQEALALTLQMADLTGTAQAMTTATAQANTAATETRAAQFTVTALFEATAQVRAAREAQTATFWQWLPVGVMVLLILVTLRWVRVLETRQRVIAQPHGGPLIVLEQRPSLARFLPRWLRAVVWFVERETVVIDPDRSLHPVTFIAPETAAQPAVAEPGAQERTTARDQAVQLVAALPTGPARRGPRLAEAMVQSQLALGPPPAAEIAPGEVQVVAPDAVQPWLDELRQKLLTEGESHDHRHPI